MRQALPAARASLRFVRPSRPVLVERVNAGRRRAIARAMAAAGRPHWLIRTICRLSQAALIEALAQPASGAIWGPALSARIRAEMQREAA